MSQEALGEMFVELWLVSWRLESASQKSGGLRKCHHVTVITIASVPFNMTSLRYIFDWFCPTTGQGVDEPLSETGFRQAAAAGQFLNGVYFTHAFCSDLTRTKQVSSG